MTRIVLVTHIELVSIVQGGDGGVEQEVTVWEDYIIEAHHSTVQPNSVTEKAVRVRRAVGGEAHHSADNSPSGEEAVRVRRAVVRAAHHSADNSTSREEAARVRRAVVRAAHHSTGRNSHPRERAERVRRAVGGEAHHSKDPFTSEPPSTRSRAQKSRQRRREALTRFLQDQLRKNPRPPETSTDHTVPAGREISPPPSLATVARVNVSGEKCVTANQPEFTPPQRPKPQVQQHSPLSISGTPTSLPPTPGAKIKPPFCSERASTNSDSSWDGSVESLWLNSKIEGRSGSNEAKDLGRNTQTALEKEEVSSQQIPWRPPPPITFVCDFSGNPSSFIPEDPRHQGRSTCVRSRPLRANPVNIPLH
ncbi:hypothetical protein DMENIID0001_078280 [Sergentomyia squamirostris]